MADHDLPELRQLVITKFTEASLADSRILAAFLGGSLAAGTSDEFSDLDLYLVISDPEYANFFSDRSRFVSRLGRPVFAEDFNEFGFDMIVFIMDNGIEGEIALGSESRFLTIHGGPLKVLVDKKKLLEDVNFPLDQPEYSDQVRLLTKNIYWFWREVSLFSVASKRGQTWTAYGYLENARRRVIDLLRLKYDFYHWPSGYEKVEEVVPLRDLASVGDSLIQLQRTDSQTAIYQLIEIFRPVAKELCQRYAIDYPMDLDQTVSDKKLNFRSENST
jgi:predicted nucleotidyltransferase